MKQSTLKPVEANNLSARIRVLTVILFSVLVMSACVFPTMQVSAREAAEETVTEDGWVSFLLLCNEGMSNRGGNAGNTMMVISMNELTGDIRLMMFTWDTFIAYEGYDVPQKLDMAYRNNGPEEAVKVFNDNFDMGIKNYLSLNYLNLATLIDTYGGVEVDVTRAERNALNGMVDSKKEYLKAMEDANLLDQLAIDLLAKEYYLEETGPETHLNGLQAVAFGWLQYDSVYNCCEREVEVIASLFNSVSRTLEQEVVFYDNNGERPDANDSRRIINLDDLTDDDVAFLKQAVSPIFETSYHDMEEEDILSITLALARVSYEASMQGVNIVDQIKTAVLPVEADQPYELIAGVEGHVIDIEKNKEAMSKFLYGDNLTE